MIAYFPTAYPDELWYGLCSRFSDRMRFGTETGVMQALYGNRHAIAIVDLPHRLGALVSQLPNGHPCTVNEIIDNQCAVSWLMTVSQPSASNAARAPIGSAHRNFFGVVRSAITKTTSNLARRTGAGCFSCLESKFVQSTRYSWSPPKFDSIRYRTATSTSRRKRRGSGQECIE